MIAPSRWRRRPRVIGVAVVALVAAGFAATPAAAGTILYTTNRCLAGDDCGYKLFRAGDDGTGERRLTFNRCGAWEGDWSPNGSQIAYSRLGGGGTSCRDLSELWVMRPDGSGQGRVTAPSAPTSDRDPDWSPDGRRLVFTRGRFLSRHAQIWSVGVDGRNPVRLTNEPRFGHASPQFSRNGRRILYVRFLPNGHYAPFESDVWLMNADGSSKRPLTRGGRPADDVAYSPDGSRIAFSHAGAIYTMTADGAGVRRWTDPRFGALDPVWAPDAGAILYDAQSDLSAPDSLRNLFRVDLRSGVRPVQVTHDRSTLDDSRADDWFRSGRSARGLGPDRKPPVVLIFGSRGVAVAKARRARSSSASRPRAQTAARRLKTRRRSLRISAIDRTGIRRVDVAIARRSRFGCRFLGRRGFRASRACRRRAYVRVRGARQFKRLVRRLRRGRYLVHFRTVDVRGNRGRTRAAVRLRITGR